MKIIPILLFLSLLVVSCDVRNRDHADNSTAIVVEDTQGNEVVLDAPARRIVCLFDPSVEVLYMLEAQDRLVGIPAETYFDKELFDYYKQIDERIEKKELATPGSNELINIESVIALKPDLVIAQQLSPSMINTLKSMGIAVYLSTSESYEHLMQEMRDIAKLTGTQGRADHLIAYAQQKINVLQDRAKTSADNSPKKVYFTWANGRIFSTAGRNSMMNNCLELAGVENACPAKIDKPNINPETLITWNPDMIVMWNDSPDLFYQKKELAEIEAVKNKKIFNLMPMFYYNPHTFKSLCAAVAINNWAYANEDSNAVEEVKEIIMELYGKDAGEKLIKLL